MSQIIISVSVFFLSFPVFASSESSVTLPATHVNENIVSANIARGNFEVGGGVNVGVANGEMSSSLDPYFRYFVIDRLSLGLAGVGSFNSNYQTLGFGPSVSLYFLKLGRTAFFLGQDILKIRSMVTTVYGKGVTDTEWYETWQFRSKVGANFFIIPQIAIGPTVSYINHMDNGKFRNLNLLEISGQFSVFF